MRKPKSKYKGMFDWEIEQIQKKCLHKHREVRQILNVGSYTKCMDCYKIIRTYRRKAAPAKLQRLDKLALLGLGIYLMIVLFSIVKPTAMATDQPIISPLPDNYKVVSPTPTPTTKPLTDYELIHSLPYGEIVWKVYRLESSAGKNDKCKEKGKFNGFGYGQNTFVWNCFDSLEIVAKKVSKWFEKHLFDKTIEEALCYYNIGKITKTCTYLEKYNEL
jgi:hypothetical protein